MLDSRDESPPHLCNKAIQADDPAALQTRFEAEHERMYGYIAPEEPIQLVTFRLEATGWVPKSEFQRVAPAEGTPDPLGARNVWLGDVWVETALYDRGALGPGHRLQGPAIVEQIDSTTLILPGQSAHIDTYGNIVIEEAGA